MLIISTTKININLTFSKIGIDYERRTFLNTPIFKIVSMHYTTN